MPYTILYRMAAWLPSEAEKGPVLHQADQVHALLCSRLSWTGCPACGAATVWCCTQQAKLVLAPVAAQQQQESGCGIEAVAAPRPLTQPLPSAPRVVTGHGSCSEEGPVPGQGRDPIPAGCRGGPVPHRRGTALAVLRSGKDNSSGAGASNVTSSGRSTAQGGAAEEAEQGSSAGSGAEDKPGSEPGSLAAEPGGKADPLLFCDMGRAYHHLLARAYHLPRPSNAGLEDIGAPDKIQRSLPQRHACGREAAPVEGERQLTLVVTFSLPLLTHQVFLFVPLPVEALSALPPRPWLQVLHRHCAQAHG